MKARAVLDSLTMRNSPELGKLIRSAITTEREIAWRAGRPGGPYPHDPMRTPGAPDDYVYTPRQSATGATAPATGGAGVADAFAVILPAGGPVTVCPSENQIADLITTRAAGRLAYVREDGQWLIFRDGWRSLTNAALLKAVSRIGREYLEPISKSFKQYQQGCELHKAQEVVRIVLPARHNTALPLEPGKKALDLPPPRVAT